MAKAKKIIYFCQECGYESAKWQGQCPGCRAWNTLVEEAAVPAKAGGGGSRGSGKLPQPVSIAEIETRDEQRVSSGIRELDRVLGGGIVGGSLMLVGGDPGIGKSTLLLQVCRNLAREGHRVLYISGEESLRQIKLRAGRIGEFSPELSLLCETNLGDIRQVIERTKPEGNVAGPRVLEHMVDTVLYFEGDRHASYRVLRGVKNRFGSTNEIGVFEMRGEGLAEVENPSEYMLSGKPQGASGSVVACSMEGTRPILLEIQALVCHSNFGIPRRTAAGTDFNRVNLLMAVLEKRLGMNLSAFDAYVNIAGGIRMTEPAIDLGIVLAIISSFRDRAISEDLLAFGEVGLSGEVRAVSMAEQRVLEARKLGFHKVILPGVCMPSLRGVEGIELIPVNTVGEAAKKIV